MKIAKQIVLALGIVSLAACGGGSGGETGSTAPVTSDVENVGSNSSNSSTSTSTGTSGSTTTTAGNTGSGTSTASSESTPQSGSETGGTETGSTPPETSPTPAAPTSIGLSWDIPASREDGSYLPVYEISGYELRYTRDNSAAETVVRIDDAQTTDWVFDNVEPGSYEFTIATIDSDGMYSEFSAPATRTVQ